MTTAIWVAAAIAATLVLVPAWNSSDDGPRGTGPTQSLSPVGADLCGGTPDPLRAVVPAFLEEAITQVAGTECVDLDVEPAGGRAGAQASEAGDVDLWISDSTLWDAARDRSAGPARSIGTSPVVAVVQPVVARRLGDDGTLSWGGLVAPGREEFIAFHDPAATATGLLTAWPMLRAQRGLDSKAYRPLAMTAAALTNPLAVPTDWVSRPGANQIVFAGEYAVTPGADIRVLRGREGEPILNFPAYNLAAGTERADTVRRVIDALTSDAFADSRAALRLRSPDGAADFDLTGLGEARKPMEMPSEETVVKLFGLSASGSARGRSLVALDVSGSMAESVAGGGTRFDSVRQTALLAMSALYDHTAIGLWTFGSRIDGNRDYREVVPIRKLAVNRQPLIQAAKTIGPVPGSGTGLYDTVLAGFQELQRTYEDDAVHSLVVMTDGKNADDAGLTERRLIRELRELSDPERPVMFVGVGFGDADMAALQRIADTTGGRAVRIDDPLQMLGVLITVVGELSLV